MKPRFLIALIVAMLGVNACCAESEGAIDPFLGDPTIETQQLVVHGRSQIWPNVVVATDGSVLAFYGRAFGGGEPFAKNRRHVALRRSEDGGRSWGEEIVIAEPGFQGGGTIVDEKSGDILAFVEERHPPAPLTIYRSKDNGKPGRLNRRLSFVQIAEGMCRRCT